MTGKTVFLYLTGHAGAVREVAASRSAWWVGALLVLSAGLAREYDQAYLPYAGIRVFYPLVASFAAVCILHLFIEWFVGERIDPLAPQGASLERHAPRYGNSFRAFLGLFWMTAPAAWLYAIPVERFYDARGAAVANAYLLLAVSVWRVALFTRAVCVATGAGWARVLGAILLPSSVMMGIGSLVTGLSLIRMMGGMRLSPAEQVVEDASGIAFLASLAGFVLSIVLLLCAGRRTRGTRLPAPAEPGAPWIALAAVAVLWIPPTLFAQGELGHAHRVKVLMWKEDYRGALAYLSEVPRGKFPPNWQLPPDPYEMFSTRELPKVFAALDGSEADWVRAGYLKSMDVLLKHDFEIHRWMWFKQEDFVGVLEALGRIPEGRDWAQAHREALVKVHDNGVDVSTADANEGHARRRACLATLGIEVPALQEEPKAEGAP